VLGFEFQQGILEPGRLAAIRFMLRGLFFNQPLNV
jgi:hypothetical protein